jgi:beta-xylosidase
MATHTDPDRWRDPTRPVAERVAALLAQMRLEEKVAQLYGVWVGVDPDRQDVAPHQHDLADASLDFPALIRSGLGQLTRPFGTAAVDPTDGAKALARLQADIAAANRFGIPALVHEECLTGFMTWQATVYPTPLAWGASFDPELVGRMAAQIGTAMAGAGVHQGLAPVLDVARDPRWGRTEETIGEDPYLVATVGTAYVRGLQSTGVLATLKHFAGYSASAAGRNLGPAAVGQRELADVLLPPFEMAVRDGGADSVMSAYTALDGMPSAADRALLTDLLRDRWGFTGTVVADYFGVSFLELLHEVAGSPAEAAGLALAAGVDVELPTVRCFGEPLLAAVRAGAVDESLVDLAATRVLAQKCRLGLLDPDWTPEPPALREAGGSAGVDLDPPAGRALARALAEESVVLLANRGALPLPPHARIAVVGPLADDPAGMLGCYTFPNHVPGGPAGRGEPAGGDGDPDHAAGALGVTIPSLLAALRAELPAARISHAAGCPVTGPDRGGIAAAAALAADAEVCLAVLGDRSGMFGRGTSGEGCDAEDLRLPGQQEALLAALLATGTPVVLVLLAGRPYAVPEPHPAGAGPAAVVQAFFPGQAGGPAIADVLSGRVNPSGRLPVSVPRRPASPAGGYLAPVLGRRTDVSSIDPTPRFPFGHGLSYTSFGWDDLQVAGGTAGGDPVPVATDGAVTVSVRVRNTGDRAGTEVVQLYLHDPVGQVTRPVVRLVGYARVPLAPGQARRVRLRMPADLASFTGRRGRRVVEPGTLQLRLGSSSADIHHTVTVALTGPERELDHRRQLVTEVTVE